MAAYLKMIIQIDQYYLVAILMIIILIHQYWLGIRNISYCTRLLFYLSEENFQLVKEQHSFALR
jgi:hypothetical protein